MAAGRFQRVIADAWVDPTCVRRILLCSGKVYFELQAARQAQQRDDVALVRVEQFYPLADETLAAALATFCAGTLAFWVQEEPENMGAWPHFRVRFGQTLLGRWPLERVTRPASASPASGSAASYKLEQERLVAQALANP